MRAEGDEFEVNLRGGFAGTCVGDAESESVGNSVCDGVGVSLVSVYCVGAGEGGADTTGTTTVWAQETVSTARTAA